jgi:hypothetical protein
MKKSTWFSTLAALASLVLTVGSAHAATITIANHSFETPVNPDSLGGFANGESRDFGDNLANNTVETGDENRITSWTTVTVENVTVAGAQIAVGFRDITPSVGNQVISLMSGASTRQFTSLTWSGLAVGDELTMTVAIGDRSAGSTWADQSFFGLIDGSTTGTLAAGTLLSSTVANSGELVTPFTGGLGIDGGTMQDRSFTYTVQAADLLRIGNVGVLLAGFGTTGTGNGLSGTSPNANQAFFDNVRLDYAAIPEPSAALLGGLGLLALLRRRR